MYLKPWWYDLQFLRIRVWQTNCPFNPPVKNPKNQNFEKMKKLLKISLYTCVPKTTIIWGTLSEVRQTDICPFVPFLHFFPPPPPQLLTQKIIILKKWKNYMKMSSFYICVPKITIICLLRYGCNTRFLAVWVFFCPFTPLLTPKIKNWKKKKKIRRHFLFHMCTINNDSWDIRRNTQKFLSFWTIFCPFIPLTNQKIKILKKWKNPWRYYHFTFVYHEWQSYDVRFLRYRVQQAKSFLILDHFLPFYWKIKI